MRQRLLPAAPTMHLYHRLFSSGLHLCIRQPRFYLCGLEPEQLMEAGYQMYIDHVPDADLQMLLEVNKKGFDLFNELPVGDRLDYTISYDFFHLTNGRHSRLIHHHLTPILLSDDGRIWLALCTVSLAATDEPGHIIMQKNGERSIF